MHDIFTQRLHLRRFEAADAPFLLALNSDPEVIRYTGDKIFASLDDALERIALYDGFEAEYGVSRWATFLRETNTFIGWCGLLPDKDEAGNVEFDLGYRFMQAHWGKGYATESARAVVDWAFNTRGITSLILKVEEENAASIGVFHKLGAVYERHGEDVHGTYAQYRLTPTTFIR